MRRYQFSRFGLDQLRCLEVDEPQPSAGELRLQVKALSLNYRDLAVIEGSYNPRLPLPATPLSDAAGVVEAVGSGVTRVAAGDRVMTHFIAGWLDGEYRGEYRKTTLGAPGPGLAADKVVLPAEAVLPIPKSYDFGQAATLPIAALTAWSALVTEGSFSRDRALLTLGTGGVSIFALQLAKAMNGRVLITSSRDDKLERARALGADHTINYQRHPSWERIVVELTDGQGVDVVLETGGIGTLNHSLKAVRPGGTIALIGSLTGVEGPVNIARIFMNRVRVAGILVDSRASFADMVHFLESHHIEPVVDRTFAFGELPQALRHMKSGVHFGKIVVTL